MFLFWIAVGVVLVLGIERRKAMAGAVRKVMSPGVTSEIEEVIYPTPADPLYSLADAVPVITAEDVAQAEADAERARAAVDVPASPVATV